MRHIGCLTNGAGLPTGTRYRMGSMEYVVGDGVGMMLDNTAFAGSTTLLNQMIPILRDVVGVPLVEAIRMATLTPARAIGEDASIGSIAPGKRADLAIFEDDFSAWRVMIGGSANQQISKSANQQMTLNRRLTFHV